uniref:Uncharacterized protein n=1 Tax=uncultured marine microorganism HF4000_005I08 TaxID=455507 RepID=B3T0G9_9ZZZZ|nr:hypothetical protein ALOHA_HF4000005I08ctg1g5 [uncultured marine microorganism HF4000_005I08]
MICDEDPLRRRPRKSTARRKRQEKGVWMTENMGKLPSGHRKTEKSGRWIPAEEKYSNGGAIWVWSERIIRFSGKCRL